MTVYLSLSLLVMLSLICTLTEGIRIQYISVRSERELESSLRSCLAQYNRVLLEDYDLFGADFELGKDSASQAHDLLSQHSDKLANASLGAGENYNLQSYFRQSIALEQVEYLTDHSGAVLQRQILEYMKYRLSAKTINKITDSLLEAEKPNQMMGTVETDLEEIESASKVEEDLQEETSKEDSGNKQKVESGSLLQQLNNLLKQGILSLVVEDVRQVSNQMFNLDSLPSKQYILVREEEQDVNASFSMYTLKKQIQKAGEMMPNLSTTVKDLTGGVMEFAYILEKFGYYGKEKEHKVQYEIEYILAGRGNDRDNLKWIAERISWIRFGFNLAYLNSDHEKKSQVGMAVGLLNITGNPLLVKAAEWLMLSAWAYGESILDVRELLAGDQCALVKTSDQWKLQFNDLGGLVPTKPNAKDGNDQRPQGLDYSDYLRLIYLTKSASEEVRYRIMDCIEIELASRTENTAFKINQCITGIKVRGQIFVSSGFFTLPFVYADKRYGKGYVMEIRTIYGY